MTQSEKLKIVYKAVVEQAKFQQIAKEFRVKTTLISILVSKAKTKPKFISELFSKRTLKESKRELVQEVVEEMRDNNVFIDSCKMVTD